MYYFLMSFALPIPSGHQDVNEFGDIHPGKHINLRFTRISFRGRSVIIWVGIGLEVPTKLHIPDLVTFTVECYVNIFRNVLPFVAFISN